MIGNDFLSLAINEMLSWNAKNYIIIYRIAFDQFILFVFFSLIWLTLVSGKTRIAIKTEDQATKN